MKFEIGELINYLGNMAIYLEEKSTNSLNCWPPRHGMSTIYLIKTMEYRSVYTQYLRKIDDTIST